MSNLHLVVICHPDDEIFFFSEIFLDRESTYEIVLVHNTNTGRTNNLKKTILMHPHISLKHEIKIPDTQPYIFTHLLPSIL